MSEHIKSKECNIISPIWRWLTGRDTHILPCCAEHDLFYAQGGTKADRKFADKLLRQCVSSSGYPCLAWAIWLGVRLFGWRHFGDGGNKHEQNIQ